MATQHERNNIEEILNYIKQYHILFHPNDIEIIRKLVDFATIRLTESDNKQNNWFATILRQKFAYLEVLASKGKLDHFDEGFATSIVDYCEMFLDLNSSSEIVLKTVKDAQAVIEKNSSKPNIFERIVNCMKEKWSGRLKQKADLNRLKELVRELVRKQP
jgi:hypothetical protein